MKKQETSAQPKVVPAAVADVLTRPLKTAAHAKANGFGATLFSAFARNRLSAQPKANERGATLFPGFAWNRQNNRRATAAQLIRFHARLNLARLLNDNRGEATEKPELFERRLFRRRRLETSCKLLFLTPRRSTLPSNLLSASISPSRSNLSFTMRTRRGRRRSLNFVYCRKIEIAARAVRRSR